MEKEIIFPFDLKGRNTDNLSGTVSIDDIVIHSEENGLWTTGPIALNSNPKEDEKSFSIESDFVLIFGEYVGYFVFLTVTFR